MHIALTYRPGDGVTATGPHAAAARDLMAAGMAWSPTQRRWYAPASRLDPARLAIVADALTRAGHQVTRHCDADDPALHEVTRSPAARAHRQERAARTAAATCAVEAIRAEVTGLERALAHLPPTHPIAPALEARLDRARGRLHACTAHADP